MIVSVGDVKAKCRACGRAEFNRPPGDELALETVLSCRDCGASTTYRELLEQIGEEAMRRANEAIAELKKRSPRRRKPKK